MTKSTAIWMYNRSKISSLFQAYANPSWEKQKAFIGITHEMQECGGHDIRITGYNCSFFSCAYKCGDKLIYHTYARKYEYQL